MDDIHFDKVGGLETQIRRLKEMVIFPIIYKDAYQKNKMQVPGGVLFYGPPGTGKTLMAKALVNECNRADMKVTFFYMNATACLSKWVGESEREIRTLFEKAEESKPSIIFFDEFDALAPKRNPDQDQVYSSIVSTLLTLMDGIKSRSQEVIVIGATNRIDAIDPAFRRPGRFDHELYFPFPTFKARRDILHICMDEWKYTPDDDVINELAHSTVGLNGSHLQALCNKALMSAFRRSNPHVYTSDNKVKLIQTFLKVEESDFMDAKKEIIPLACKTECSPVKPLANHIHHLLKDKLNKILDQMKSFYPFSFLHPESEGCNNNIPLDFPRILLSGMWEKGQTSHLGPATLHYLEHLTVYTLDISTVFMRGSSGTEEACILKMEQVHRNLPAVLYLPILTSWWDLVTEPTRNIFLYYMKNIFRNVPLFLLATSHKPYKKMPKSLQELFQMRYQVTETVNPSRKEKYNFFKSLFVNYIQEPSSQTAENICCASHSDGVRECSTNTKQNKRVPTVSPRKQRSISKRSCDLPPEEMVSGNDCGPTEEPARKKLKINFNRKCPEDRNENKAPFASGDLEDDEKRQEPTVASGSDHSEDAITSSCSSDNSNLPGNKTASFKCGCLFHCILYTSENYSVELLEVLYKEIEMSIKKHKNDWNSPQLSNEIKKMLTEFECKRNKKTVLGKWSLQSL